MSSTKLKETYYTRKQVCEWLHISVPTLHKLINEGGFPRIKLGGRTLFSGSDIEGFMESLKEVA